MRTSWVMAALASVSLLAGTTAAAASARPPIRIGEIAALTGPTALTGLQEQMGAKLAVAEINRAGGVLGRPLKLITLDFGGSVQTGVADYRRLVEDDHVSAVIGTNFSNVNIAMAPVTQRLKVPDLSDSIDLRATMQPDGKPYTYAFLAQPSADAWGRIMAKVALHLLKARRAAILLNQDNAFAVAQAKPFEAYFSAHGGKIVSVQEYTSSTTEYTSLLTTIAASHPQVVLIPNYGQHDGLAVQEARQLGLKAYFLGPNTFSTPDYTKVAGAAANGTYFVNNVDLLSPRYRGFDAAFRKMFHSAPKTVNAFFGYDDVHIIAAAIAKAHSSSPAAITRALDHLKNVPILEGNGTFTMDAALHRPLRMPVTVFEWVKGRAVDKGLLSSAN